MKVLFDHQAFSIQQYGGISRYFIELFNKLEHTPDLKLKHTPQFSNNVYLEQYQSVKHVRFLSTDNNDRNQTIMRHTNNLISLASVAAGKYDVFHPTYYDPYFLRVGIHRPFVVTFHDMIHEHFHKLYPELNTPLIAHKKMLLAKSTAIISVSESTKRDILALYDVPEDKIKVIPLASSLQPFMPSDDDNKIGDYLLYVGNRSLYKNFIFFIEAVAALLAKYKNLKILCAGGGTFTAQELHKLHELKVTEQVEQVSINDKKLALLYSNALGFVFPTLYEGFGIPTIEAMSCGCPVLASNISSVPEVGADAALYFNPTDKDSISETVEKLLTDSGLRQRLIKKGYERAAQFSWQNTASLTHQVYKQVI